MNTSSSITSSRDGAPLSDVLVLGYHSVSPTWPAVTSVRPDRFEEQLTHLVERGYRGATLRDALTAPSAPKTLVVTFDDAHRSVRELAEPILTRLGLPATVFVPTHYATTGELMGWELYDKWLGTAHEHEVTCMSWDELSSLAGKGWEIGSHTVSHPRLPALDDRALAAELAESRRQCEERLRLECHSFAYPYSDYDARVVEATRDAGYRFAVTIPRRYEPALPLVWPRVGVYHHDTTLRFRARLVKRSPRYHALRTAASRSASRPAPAASSAPQPVDPASNGTGGAGRRILMVINTLGRAGAESQAIHLAMGLAAGSDRVTIACIKEIKNDRARFERAGVEVVELHALSRLSRLRALPKLVRMARRADIVYCVTWDATLWARLAAIAARRPVVVSEQAGGRDIQVSRSGAPRGRWIALQNRLLDRFTFATVACAPEQIPWLQREGVDDRRLLHIANAVPVDELRRQAREGVTRADLGIPQEAKVVVHVARLQPLKNHKGTLAAVARLREELGDVRLVLVGKGPEEESLRRQAQELGGEDWIHFAGHRSDVPPFFGLADLAVLPSFTEGMPVSILEGIAVGTPVVATDVGGVRGVLEATGAGIIVPPNDPEAFYQACRRVLSDAELHQRLVSRALASRHYDASTMTRRYSELFSAALEGRPASAVAPGWDRDGALASSPSLA